MAELLDALHLLANADRDARHLRRQVTAQQRRIAKIRDDIEAKSDDLLHSRAAAADHDLQVNAYDEKIAKMRVDLNKARTNKEYAAVLTQINTAKADSAKLEGTTLELMEEIDTQERVLSELQEQLGTEEERLTRLESACQAFEEETAEELAALEHKRDQVAEDIPPQALSTFVRVADNYEGEALAQVVQLHPKRQEYSCAGCNMGVRLEQVNALKSKNEIECCNICGRILYLDAPTTQTV
jgi:predicted  nucleic acid-binding Zn-ribbon protein